MINRVYQHVFISSRTQGIGRKKTSIATVTLVPGTGLAVINHKQASSYFQFNQTYINIFKAPLIFLGFEQLYDIYASVHGGGLRGQVEAIKLGVARMVYSLFLENQTELKSTGLLTRDSRRKERKKFGLKKARKAPQFSKR